jgi:hypothetical protein
MMTAGYVSSATAFERQRTANATRKDVKPIADRGRFIVSSCVTDETVALREIIAR